MTCTADDVTSIVIDSGSSWTRVGYSGENTPRHVIPTVYGKDSNEEYYFGDERVHAVNHGKEIYSPMSDGCVQDWNAMSRLWKWVYDEKLRLDPREMPLVLTEQLWNPLVNKQRALEVAFEDLQVPVFSLVKAPLCVAYESAAPTILVVDIGSGVASVTPIVDGIVVHKASSHTRFAGDFLNMHIMNYLQQMQMPFSTPSYAVEQRAHNVEPGQPAQDAKLKQFLPGAITDSFNIFQIQRTLNDFKESTLQVSQWPLSLGQQVPVMSRPFEFPNGYNMTFGAERLATTEPLFKPLNYPLPNAPAPSMKQGLGEMIYASLSKAPSYCHGPQSDADITSELLQNVVVTGGTGQLAGLVPRLEYEVSQWVNNYKPTIGVPNERSNPVWTGASIIGSMGQFEQPYWVTKQEYEEHGTSLAEKRFK